MAVEEFRYVLRCQFIARWYLVLHLPGNATITYSTFVDFARWAGV